MKIFISLLVVGLFFSTTNFSQSVFFKLDCTQSWQNTGVQLSAGDHLIIVARGVYSDGTGGAFNLNSWSSPDGRGTFPPTSPGVFLSDNSPIGSLIGKIGPNGEAFGVGSFRENISVAQNGELYLAVNDAIGGGFGDNDGYLAVQILNISNLVSFIHPENNNISRFEISQNYPNPFNPSTSIEYKIPQASTVRLIIYNIKGQKIKTLVDEYQKAGYHSVVWDSKNENGQIVSSGNYFYQVEVNNFIQAKKMILIK